MAGNGDATQQLDKIEQAITGMRQPAPRVAAELGADIMGMAEEQAQQAEAAAKYIMDHAHFLHEACTAYAREERAKAAHFAANLLAAEERKAGELRKLMGKIAG
jgi:hypothetical protein